MDIYFNRLRQRANVLGNQYKKYITIIDKYMDPLMSRLENAGMIERVHLWAGAHDYQEEMATISQVGYTLEEKLNDLSCYFAYQFLQLNLSALDALMLEITTKDKKLLVYKQFMLRVGHDFRKLSAVYMEHLMNLYLPADKKLEFVFMGVGTRSDQDDIDIGVIDRGEDGREELNRAIGRMSTEMFKKAISLHFHLSEHVGNVTSFTASVDEYVKLLELEIHDFVILTEMLGAARILGSRKLFFDFRRQVTVRYFYNPHDIKNLKFHEGYLRGIVGETRSFMFRELYRERISPKSDGLRMIKGALFAAKTIFNFRQVNAWAILEELKQRDKKRHYYYTNLEESLTFLEIFRYLYQMLISQEEEIYLNDESTFQNLAGVAEAMGYGNIGAANATDFLITDYYTNIQKAKSTLNDMLPSFVGHLSSVTVFGKLLRHKKVTEEGKKRIGNLAIRFLQESAFYRGTRFWDDIIDVLARKNGQVLKRLVHDLCRLSPERKEVVLHDYIEWSWNSFIATFSFILLLHRYRAELPDCKLFEEFNRLFFERIHTSAEIAQRLSTVFKNYPNLMYEYIKLLTEDQQKSFYNLLDINVWDQEVLPVRNRLRYLIKLQYGTSKYFNRVMDKVIARHPEYLHFLDDSRRLLLIGKGKLAEVERTQDIQQKLDKIRSYHHFEFFRACLNAFSGKSVESIALDFTVFSDTYLRLLFDLCKLDMDERRKSDLKTKDLLGIFVTGGHGQMLAFDDDYDLIILLNSDDKDILNYCSSIISRMHREVVKCGIMPHYRFSQYTSTYVCTFSQLSLILKDTSKDVFIDMSQLLAARMVVGSSILQRAFEDEIITPYIYNKKQDYIHAMYTELERRQQDFKRTNPNVLNIKESPGGLRDIEMLIFIIKALYEISDNSNFKILIQLQENMRSLKSQFEKLYSSYTFLRVIRNLNRLIIAADDSFDIRYIDSLAENLNGEDNSSATASQTLFHDVEKTMNQVTKIIKKISQRIGEPISKE